MSIDAMADNSTPLTVLVVDDESPVRSVSRRILESGNWTVIEASSSGEALRLIATEPSIRLVITDVRMPGMNGIELTREIRALGRWLPVLYVTGYPYLLFAGRQILSAGTAFLTKPFSRLGLLQAARQVLAMPDDRLMPRYRTTTPFVFPERLSR